MKKLNVLFSDKVELQIDDINELTQSTLSKSIIVRAAMQLGLNHLKEYENIDDSQFTLDEFITIQNLKATN